MYIFYKNFKQVKKKEQRPIKGNAIPITNKINYEKGGFQYNFYLSE